MGLIISPIEHFLTNPALALVVSGMTLGLKEPSREIPCVVKTIALRVGPFLNDSGLVSHQSCGEFSDFSSLRAFFTVLLPIP